MRKTIWAALAVATLFANTTWAQIDLGGAISGAINGATGNTQAAASAAANAGVPGVNGAAGVNASGNVNQGAGQSWIGRVGNDIRGALQQADNGSVRLQNNLNPSLQQYGFRPGDQLLNSKGQPLTQAQFDQYLQTHSGQVRVLRNGQTVVLNGNMQGQNMQGQMSGSGQVYQPGQMSGQAYGSAGMSGQGRQRLGITMNQSGEGVTVTAVTMGSPASQAGLRPGDQIISVNGQAVANPNSMIQLVGSTAPNQALDVQYRRNGQVMQSQVTLAGNANASSGMYQAGYGQGGESADVNARLGQLERMVQELRDQIQQLSGAKDQPSDSRANEADSENK